MTALVDDTVATYLTILRRAGVDFESNLTFGMQVEILRATLAAADTAMLAEGLGREARSRVIRTVAFGTADEDAGERQMAMYARMVAAAQRPVETSAELGLEELNRGCPCGRLDCPDRPAV